MRTLAGIRFENEMHATQTGMMRANHTFYFSLKKQGAKQASVKWDNCKPILWSIGVIIYIGQRDRARNRENIKQYLRLRKRVFCDRYGWVEPKPDCTESDALDNTYNVIVLYLDPNSQNVVGRCPVGADNPHHHFLVCC